MKKYSFYEQSKLGRNEKYRYSAVIIPTFILILFVLLCQELKTTSFKTLEIL